ncbi:EF-hand domain-containing protein [Allokutzneria oryzae]|uniref:EF-hand domain-containing protein n=1 Tax=Allokutzneria oryzae TaxID=1378989 RepID=A0ABV5ZWN4_9PSEU
MPTSLQQHRLTREFNRYDVDGDGTIDQTDIDGVVQSLCSAHRVVPGSPAWREITSRANRLWYDLIGHLDDDGDRTVSREEWVAAHDRPGFIDAVAIPLARFAFEIGDADQDGRMSLNEWMISHTVFGSNQLEALESFQSLDEDGDGYVTADEHAAAVARFYSEQ